MKPGGGRRKGHAFEREVAEVLRDVFPDAKRGFQFRGGAEAADIIGCPGYHFECKRGKQPNPRAALAQAIRDCAMGTVPIGIVKDDRKEPFAVIQLGDLVKLLKDLHSDEVEV